MRGKMKNSGFSLVEMLTVIAIAGILAAIAFPMIFKTLQSDTTVKSAAKTVIADMKTAQSEAMRRGGGEMQGGVLVEKSVFVVFPAGTNTYRVWAYTDTDGDGVHDAGEATSITAATSLPSSVRFGASAIVTDGPCLPGGAAPIVSGFSFGTPSDPPCNNNACLELDGNGFISMNSTISLTNGTDNYGISINQAGNFTLCKWPQGATAWQIVR